MSKTILLSVDGSLARFRPDTATLLASGDDWQIFLSKTDRFVLVETDDDEGESALVLGTDTAMDYLHDGKRTPEGERLLAEYIASLPEV